jgi:hypothetical protein
MGRGEREEKSDRFRDREEKIEETEPVNGGWRQRWCRRKDLKPCKKRKSLGRMQDWC